MAQRMTAKLAANFQRNLADIEQFLIDTEAPQAFDGLLDELMETTVPNLERFPGLGRPFLDRVVRSAEAANATTALEARLTAMGVSSSASLREYVMAHYLVLYVQVDDTVYLLSIRHHRQLSFDFEGNWGMGV